MIPRTVTRAILLLLSCAAGPVSSYAEEAAPAAHFHHIRLNVTSARKTARFYKKYFGAVEIDYHGKTPGLFTERSFVLMNEVSEPPPHGPRTAISHIGWAAVDGQATYEWLKKNRVKFQTEIANLGNDTGMYVFGPDNELVEVWTGTKAYRFDHVHLWANDVEKMAAWFKDTLGLEGRVGKKPTGSDPESIFAIQMAFFVVGNVNLVIFGKPDFESVWWPGVNYKAEDAPPDFEPTKGTVIDHLAFSYRQIEPEFERMKAAGVEIVEPVAEREVGHRSFYVQAPDGILIEIVEGKPIPEASWE